VGCGWIQGDGPHWIREGNRVEDLALTVEVVEEGPESQPDRPVGRIDTEGVLAGGPRIRGGDGDPEEQLAIKVIGPQGVGAIGPQDAALLIDGDCPHPFRVGNFQVFSDAPVLFTTRLDRPRQVLTSPSRDSSAIFPGCPDQRSLDRLKGAVP